MTWEEADLLPKDPAVAAILKYAASMNVRVEQLQAIRKILEWGVIPLEYTHTEYQVPYREDGNYHIPNHIGDLIRILPPDTEWTPVGVAPTPPDKTLNDYAREVHAANQKWWRDIRTGERLNRNFGELIALVHSELSEALEGHRKDLADDKLPHRRMIEVELADALIRIFDIGAGFNMDLEGAYQEKMEYNAHRADHKPENRILPGGKAY